ncbi:hypothetical protein P1X14_16565 [Sphingomonas sp. AOB5]|uniref:hypothetical protein n=1 Tax=Sphingomonas sp. AOB5 TaxID=3034017 RepID=UPI0023F85C4A|nr:hypothetical protein [Sphingomonas sp. AOB5]MDF7776872.1 hypothetical protein [Sphingomonas sp. AOB5]
MTALLTCYIGGVVASLAFGVEDARLQRRPMERDDWIAALGWPLQALGMLFEDIGW